MPISLVTFLFGDKKVTPPGGSINPNLPRFQLLQKLIDLLNDQIGAGDDEGNQQCDGCIQRVKVGIQENVSAGDEQSGDVTEENVAIQEGNKGNDAN